jgi:hypothetical protein
VLNTPLRHHEEAIWVEARPTGKSSLGGSACPHNDG